MGYVAFAVAVASTAYSVDQSEKARSANNKSRDAQKKAQAEQKAAQAQQAAQERRQQIREERVRRARILQSGENTGTGESSGEFGAIGSLATQLGSNIGFNLGMIDNAQRRSDFLQIGADYAGQASGYQLKAQYGQQVGQLSGSIFNTFGGQSKPPAGTTGAGSNSAGMYPSPQTGP